MLPFIVLALLNLCLSKKDKSNKKIKVRPLTYLAVIITLIFKSLLLLNYCEDANCEQIKILISHDPKRVSRCSFEYLVHKSSSLPFDLIFIGVCK